MTMRLDGTHYPKVETHYHWAGDSVTYKGLHLRINRELGKADRCVNGCVTTTRYEWAHIHGTDPLDVANYQPMCVGCHRRYDHSGENNHSAKLNWKAEEVRALRYFDVSQHRLAKMYNVSHPSINNIVNGKTSNTGTCPQKQHSETEGVRHASTAHRTWTPWRCEPHGRPEPYRQEVPGRSSPEGSSGSGNHAQQELVRQQRAHRVNHLPAPDNRVFAIPRPVAEFLRAEADDD